MKSFGRMVRGIALVTCLTAAPAAMAQSVTQIDDVDQLPGAVRAYLDDLGAPFALAEVISGGDLTGDDIDDAVVRLWYFNLNSVDASTLVLRGVAGGGDMQYVGQAQGVYGEQPSNVEFNDGVVTFQTLTVGPDDQRCCPTQVTDNRLSIDDVRPSGSVVAARPSEIDRAFLRAAFDTRRPLEREAVQNELSYWDLYGGAIDGVYGRGTEEALVAMLARLAGDGVELELGSVEGVSAALDLIGRPSSYSHERYGAGRSYDGVWDCNFEDITIRDGSYRLTSADERFLIGEGSIIASEPDEFIFDMMGATLEQNGNRLFYSITPNTMGLHDPVDASYQLCRRRR